MDKKAAMEMVVEEYNRAVAKHGQFNSDMEGYALLKEELDELWDDIKNDQQGRMLADEAKQVGAMALKFFPDKEAGIKAVMAVNVDVDMRTPHEGYAHLLGASEILWRHVKSDDSAILVAASYVGAGVIAFLQRCCD